MKVICYMNGYPSIHEVSEIYYYADKIILQVYGDPNLQLAAICKDIDYYNFIIKGLNTQNSIEIKDEYNFSYYFNS